MNKKKIVLAIPLAVSCLLFACQSPTASCDTGVSSTSATESLTSSSSDSSSSSTVPVHEPVTYYAANNGSATAAGTEDDPLELYMAFTKLLEGDTLILKNGTYTSNIRYLVDIGRNGTKEKPITVKAETDGEVLIDFSSMAFNSTNRGIQINSNWWVIRGLKIKGAGDNGIYIGGSYNLVERCDVYGCRDTGIQLGRASSSQQAIEEWPSFNTILNCTSHDNSDPTGEDADGFACKLTTGIGNVFKGCIAYNNIDDGWDLYAKADSGEIGPVTIEDCVAFNNGVTSAGVGLESSDGNGFKLGGESIAVQHIVKNSIAFNNLAHGFTDNSNPGSIWLENCTSYNNSIRETDANNIDLCRDETISNGNYFKNILSYSSGDYASTSHYEKEMTNSRDQYYGSANHCVFFNGLTTLKIEGPERCDYTTEAYRGTPFTPEKEPFISTDVPATGADTDGNFDFNFLRAADGSVDLGDFLRVDPTSEFYTMGENGVSLGASLHREVE